MDECRDPLRMLGIGEAFEKTIGGVEGGEGHLRPVNDRRKTLVMAFTGFAEEHGLDAAAGEQRFFDEACAFDADESVFRGKTTAERHTELLEPAIIAAADDRRSTGRSSVASGFSGCGHHRGG
jgi:hypothetical protein